eukprot:5252095-Pleurochrysis_carterae.AAC.1
MERRVRAEVRHARLNFESGIASNLVQLKEDLLHMRRSTNYERCAATLPTLYPSPFCAYIFRKMCMEAYAYHTHRIHFFLSPRSHTAAKRAELDERDALIVELKRKLAAEEKRNFLHERRLHESKKTNELRTAELTIVSTELKRVRGDSLQSKLDASRELESVRKHVKLAKAAAVKAVLETAKTKLDAAAADARDERERYAERVEELEGELREKERVIEAIEASSEDALEKMFAKRKVSLDSAEKLVEAVEALLREARAELGPRTKVRTQKEFDGLSEGAKRTARSRDVSGYAEWFFHSREWRAADVATALERCELVEDVWETREVWELRMIWLNEVLATCTSQHWGVKLGPYLTLTEHIPTRQMLRISQAAVPKFSPDPHHPCIQLADCTNVASCKTYDAETDTYRRKILVANPHAGATSRHDVIYVPSILPSVPKFAPELKAFSQQNGLAMSANGRVAVQS